MQLSPDQFDTVQESNRDAGYIGKHRTPEQKTNHGFGPSTSKVVPQQLSQDRITAARDIHCSGSCQRLGP
jgi:hypothetical protein